MPPLPGESLLVTLFADVHYYFSPPSSRPVHDRFDKGSYVYLWHNPTQSRARIEVANAAGTAEQDAFNGYLDTVLVKRKFQQSTLLSVTVDGVASGQPRQADQAQWSLPAYDLKNEQKYLYKLHSLDIYFWTANDAARFVDQLKHLLSQDQLDLIEPPSAVEHRDSMSPVVEKLEQAAIQSPPQVRTPSTNSAEGPVGVSSRNHSPQTTLSSIPEPSAVVQPVLAPYNPAAPAAPEPIAHREKTPPPVDAETGTGLMAVAMHEEGSNQFAVAPPLTHHLSYQQTPQQQTFPGPPQRSSSMQSIPPPPPASTIPGTPGLYQPAGYTSSFSSPPVLPVSSPPSQTSFPGQPHQAQYAGYPQHRVSAYQPSPALPLQSPGLPGTPGAPGFGQIPLQSPGIPQHATPHSPGLPPPPPGPPIGGHSSYNYNQQSQQPHAQNEVYKVHNQVYKPTESEATSHGHAKPVQPAKPGAFEGGIGRLEKGVGRFLRKLDKGI